MGFRGVFSFVDCGFFSIFVRYIYIYGVYFTAYSNR